MTRGNSHSRASVSPRRIRRIAGVCALLSLVSSSIVFSEDRRIGTIAFFGHEGFDTAAVLKALPFQQGSILSLGADDVQADALADRWAQDVKDAIRRSIGREPTDVTRVCCSAAGDVLVYIGLPGKSYRRIRYNTEPAGTIRLPETVLRLDAEVDNLLFKAVSDGRAGEDDSEGYALSKDDPQLRSKQLEFRDSARLNEDIVFKVADGSSDAEQRAIAATALGYIHQTQRQVRALVNASFDSDENVRNNAIRALGVLLSAKPEVARRVPMKKFLGFLSSGTWSDRNKGLLVFLQLTQKRDPQLLRDLRSEALEPLVEAARWEKGHALAARVILGRIAGIDEQQLWPIAAQDSPDTVLRAVGR